MLGRRLTLVTVLVLVCSLSVLADTMTLSITHDHEGDIQEGDEFNLIVSLGPNGKSLLKAEVRLVDNSPAFDFQERGTQVDRRNNGNVFVPLGLNELNAGAWTLSGENAGSAVVISDDKNILGKVPVVATATGSLGNMVMNHKIIQSTDIFGVEQEYDLSVDVEDITVSPSGPTTCVPDCTDATPHCKEDTDTCVACLEDVHCGSGKSCINNVCGTKDTGSSTGGTDTGGTDDTGTTDPCDDIKCPSTQTCQEGKCITPQPVDLCADVKCNTGETCVKGRCLVPKPVDPCDGVTCDAGQQCQAGQCVAGCGSDADCGDLHCIQNQCTDVLVQIENHLTGSTVSPLVTISNIARVLFSYFG